MAQIDSMETIRRRTSLRSYDGRALSPEDRRKLEEILTAAVVNPFGAQVRLPLVETGDRSARKLGTYGTISGAGLFIAGVVRRSDKDLEGLGFSLERAVLQATAIGLGTCWLAGTFDHGGFAKAAAVSGDEALPAVSPVGYPAKSRTLRDSLMRTVARSSGRKPWSELFFDGAPSAPLTQPDAGPWAEALEAVRLAPSAANGQPWRVVRQADGFYFFRKSKSDSSRLDLGIAACHFELVAHERVAHERGLGGSWIFDQAPMETPIGWEYAFTWKIAQQ